MLKRIVRFKVYYDRSRQYWNYAKTIIIMAMAYKLYEDSQIGIWLREHQTLSVIAIPIGYIALSLVMGYFDKRFNVREYEQGEMNSTNPDFRIIRYDLKKIKAKLDL